MAEIADALQSVSADACHCFDPWTLELGMNLKRRRTGMRLVYDSTESFPQVYAERSDLFWPLRRFLAAKVRRIESAAIGLADGIIETNRTRARRFEENGRQVVIVPNYPPLSAVRAPVVERRPWLCWTGMMSRHRGFDVLLRAFQRVSARFPEARIKVMGEFDERESLAPWAREFIHRNGLDSQVEFLGWQPYADMFELLGHGLAGIILLQRGRYNDWTGQPNKLFDFMAAGLALVAGDSPEVGDVVRQAGCGVLLDPADDRAVADSLAAVLSDPSTAVRLGLAGRQAVIDRFNWSLAEQPLIGLYRGFWQ
jgi:glycosyltransferase involved in cell wall biosynthesis